ncbi:MAG: 4-oxalomesaconate tautomerase [Rhizobiaceae bacterium]
MSSGIKNGIPCMWMRGGTSKGGYFLADDLPQIVEERDAFLLSMMGSPDERQIDGMGGADPLTSKVAVVQKSERDGIDVDYLFLQVVVDKALVSNAQNCGNILAGVGPFAIERGFVKAVDGQTKVTIFMENTQQVAIATVETLNGNVCFEGSAVIDGVPGTNAPISLEFQETAGSVCGSLLPSGSAVDVVGGIEVTMIDNGMPCVILRGSDLGIMGTENREELEANGELRERLEALRLICGPLMNLGDVREKTIPKMTLVSAPTQGGVISTRSFIPHRCHASIGVLAAVSVASACLIEGTPANELAQLPEGKKKTMPIEHPIGETTIVARVDDKGAVESAAILRTANKLMDGVVFA